ncbi:MAG TPA: hypothetical protein DEH78_20600 [Solibacterales bacterium]|nr:hypothetical protein [Bryobacterales bacterium]
MTKRLWLAQAVGNALLAGLAWVWLGLGDAEIWQLAITAVLGLMVVCGSLWLHGGTMASFRLGATAWGRAALALPWLLVWLAAAAAAAWGAIRYGRTAGPWLAPLLVLLLLPVAGALATDGVRSLARSEAWKPFRNWRFLVIAPLVGAAAGFAAYRLIWWVPGLNGLTMQALSAAVRLGLAYLILVTAWVVILALAGRAAKPAGVE